MRALLAVAILLLATGGCRHSEGVPVGIEHLFDGAHAPVGLNTRGKPPCPYFDPPPPGAAYVFCEQCGYYHVSH